MTYQVDFYLLEEKESTSEKKIKLLPCSTWFWVGSVEYEFTNTKKRGVCETKVSIKSSSCLNGVNLLVSVLSNPNHFNYSPRVLTFSQGRLTILLGLTVNLSAYNVSFFLQLSLRFVASNP